MTWKRKEYIWYRCGHALCTFITYLMLRPKIFGKENIPKSGAILITPNHRSMLDIPVLGCAFFRPLRFMAKKDLFTNKFIRWYFQTNGSFSIDKSESDPVAIKRSVSVLKDKDALVIFPEGKRSREADLAELTPGAGFIAIKAKAPILPIAITGLDKVIHLKFGFLPYISRPKVLIGKPIISHLVSNEKSSLILKELNPELKNKMKELYEKSLKLD